MEVINIAVGTPYDSTGKIDLYKLGRALRLCHDLPLLQDNELTRLPSVVRQTNGEKKGLDLAKSLRRELISCAEEITRHSGHPGIHEILSALEEETLFSENRHINTIKRKLGIPFSRDRLDLARYYAIRLLMEGLSNGTIANFLEVEIRTLGNYISAAKRRIRLTLESRL